MCEACRRQKRLAKLAPPFVVPAVVADALAKHTWVVRYIGVKEATQAILLTPRCDWILVDDSVPDSEAGASFWDYRQWLLVDLSRMEPSFCDHGWGGEAKSESKPAEANQRGWIVAKPQTCRY